MTRGERSRRSRPDLKRATPASPHSGRGVCAGQSRCDVLHPERVTGDARAPASTLPRRPEGRCDHRPGHTRRRARRMQGSADDALFGDAITCRTERGYRPLAGRSGYGGRSGRTATGSRST
jgi:hypothetical protein